MLVPAEEKEEEVVVVVVVVEEEEEDALCARARRLQHVRAQWR